jgi:hypothetical protein
MTELREFARQSEDLAKRDVRLVPISVDDQQHAREAWEKQPIRNSQFLVIPAQASSGNMVYCTNTEPKAGKTSHYAPRSSSSLMDVRDGDA